MKKSGRRTSLRGRDFLSMLDFSREEIWEIFRTARRMKSRPEGYASRLKSRHLAMIFEKPSLRTRVSFEVGMRELGGDAIYLAPTDISLGKRESVTDVAKNLERMVHGIMIRTFSHATCTQMAEVASIPVINGLTDLEHPCQVISDLFTVWELKGDLRGLTLGFVGDGNNVAHSLLMGAARLGLHMRVGSPPGYEPKRSVLDRVMKEAGRSGSKIAVRHNPREAVDGADVVYTDVWASMGQEQEAEERRRVFGPYQVNEALFGLAKPDALFMHCLPARRGEEVSDGVVDSSQSVVFPQAENRLHVQKSILFHLMS